MCGVFGLAKKADSQNNFQIEQSRLVLQYLADESSVRGTDSTGIAFISKESRSIFKTVMPSFDMIEHEDWEEKIIPELNRSTTAVLGHVRLATHGTISVRNAHPFAIGKVVGAHNGVLNNHNELAKKMNKTIEVDSEAIFGAINKNKIKNALEKIDGDYAITFIKDDPSIVYLARESSRPLCVAYWKKAKILFWASTELILHTALSNAGLGTLKCGSLKKGIIYGCETENFNSSPIHTKEKFKPKASKYYAGSYSGSYYGYSGYQGESSRCTECGATTYYKTKLCWNCREDVRTEQVTTYNSHVQCDYCKCWVSKKDTKYADDFHWTLCGDCWEECKLEEIEQNKKNNPDLRLCDWCSDWVDKNEMTDFGESLICDGCDPDPYDEKDDDKQEVLLLPEKIERFNVGDNG